ncbi:unnamed protein product [Clavelina lepadiformis]|uniref:Uncharacterized protein n=1 Tax=Clavelina lepadiformis TaxID=159417 RepID=A0ABP0GX44_CLALP
MYRLKPMQHSLDLADRHLDNMIFEQINYNDGDEESPGIQPTSNARMTDTQSTLIHPRRVEGQLRLIDGGLIAILSNGSTMPERNFSLCYFVML